MRHSSTNFFRRAEIFAQIFFANKYSEPEAACLSSVEDITATCAVQNAGRVFAFGKTNVAVASEGCGVREKGW